MQFEINTKSLAIIIPLAISVIGGAFYLGFAINSSRIEHFKDIIEEYKESSQLDAPGLLSSLRQSSMALTLSASEKRAFDEAKERVDEYAGRIGVCDAKLISAEDTLRKMKENFAKKEVQYTASIDDLKKEIKSYVKESTNITVRRGHAVELIPNKTMLGLSSIFSDSAMININSDSMMINVGEGKSITSESRKCILWLKEVDVSNGQGFFKLNCPL